MIGKILNRLCVALQSVWEMFQLQKYFISIVVSKQAKSWNIKNNTNSNQTTMLEYSGFWWTHCLFLRVLILFVTVLWFILRGDLLYVLPCVILFLCFSVLLVLRLPRLEKRELILVLFVRFFDLRLFGFVGFLFLLVSGKGCGLWLWHSLDFSLTFFFVYNYWQWPILINCVMCYYLCVLRWLTRPILALNCLLQIEQERSEEESYAGDALALAFRYSRFCSASLILFALYSPAPLLMKHRHFVQSCASVSTTLLVC